MEPLTFRLAKPGDFDEIVKLSEGIYDGHDYLPFTFHQWLQRNNLAVILAYSGDRLVGLLASFVIDGGRTYFHRAGRVRTELRGQGVARQLTAFARTYAREHFPSLERERSMTEMANSQNRIKLLECYVSSYQVNMQASQAKISTIKSKSVKIDPCSREYFSKVILSPPVRSKLFPNNAIIINSCAFEPVRSNADHVLQECSEVFVDKCAGDALPRSISFGTFSPRVKFLHWNASVYADDPVLFKAHLLYHLKRACQVVSGDFIFASFQNRSQTHLAKKVMEEELQLTSDGDRTMILYERKLDSPSVSKL